MGPTRISYASVTEDETNTGEVGPRVQQLISSGLTWHVAKWAWTLPIMVSLLVGPTWGPLLNLWRKQLAVNTMDSIEGRFQEGII